MLAATSVIVKDGKVLSVSRKDDHRSKGFPGGKLEPGEMPYDTMVRETLEETGIRVLSAVFVLGEADDSEVRTYAYFVTEFEGEPESKEDGLVEWVEPREMIAATCSWPKYNRKVLEKLGFQTALVVDAEQQPVVTSEVSKRKTSST